MYYRDDPRYRDGNFTMFPNEAFQMDLCMGEICLYLYLLYREDRKTYTCYPSANTIAAELQLSRSTVRKYIEMLERKGLISSERTTIYTKKHGARNGNLKYTIHPIKPIADAYFEKQIRKQQAKLAAEEALKRYDARHNRNKT